MRQRAATLLACAVVAAVLFGWAIRSCATSRRSSDDVNATEDRRSSTTNRPSDSTTPRRDRPAIPIRSGVGAGSGPGLDRSEPRTAIDLDAQFPGFYQAYQNVTVNMGFRLMRRCAQLVVRSDPNDHESREWEYVDTYRRNPDGSLQLVDVDITPGSEDADSRSISDDPEYYECLKRERLALAMTIPPVPGVQWPDAARLYHRGRWGNAELSTSALAEQIASTEASIIEMAFTDPYKVALDETLEYLKCLQELGLSQEARLDCLDRFDGQDTALP